MANPLSDIINSSKNFDEAYRAVSKFNSDPNNKIKIDSGDFYSKANSKWPINGSTTNDTVIIA